MINDKNIVFEFNYAETVRGLYSDVRYKTSYSLSRKNYETIAKTIKKLFDNTRCDLSVKVDNKLIADLIAVDGAFELYLYNDFSTVPYQVTFPEEHYVIDPGIMPINLARWIAYQIFVYARHNFR